MLYGAGGNIGVSVGEDGILIVDDQYAPLADKIRAALKGLGEGKLKFVSPSVLTLLAPVITGQLLHVDPTRQDLLNQYARPGGAHLLGNPLVGRAHWSGLRTKGCLVAQRPCHGGDPSKFKHGGLP